MKQRLFQSIADFIIKKISTTDIPEVADFYLEVGFWFDGFCIDTFNIYLD